MANVLVEEQYLHDIANAIRSKNFSSNTYTPSQMATAISNISGDGGVLIFNPEQYLEGTLEEINDVNGQVTELASYVTFYQSALKRVNFPALTTINGDKKFSSGGYQHATILSVNMPMLESVPSETFYQQNYAKFTKFTNLKSVASNAFNNCNGLKGDEFPVLETIASNAFQYCYWLTNLVMPNLKSFYGDSFRDCAKIKSIWFGDVSTWTNSNAKIGTHAALERVYLPKLNSIGGQFQNSANLEMLIIGNQDSSSVCTANSSDFLSGTKIAGGTGYIYVPDSLINDYKSATNWSTYAAQIKGQSELTQSDWDKFYPTQD